MSNTQTCENGHDPPRIKGGMPGIYLAPNTLIFLVVGNKKGGQTLLPLA